MGTPAPPSQNGTIDVTPTQLYGVSGNVAFQQETLHKGANSFLDELERYPDGGGYGTAAWAFSTAYRKVGNRFLDVWARSVLSVGGAAVGFTTTANNYAAADAATHPSGNATPTHQAPPTVIDKLPKYRSVTDLKWGDLDEGQDVWEKVLEGLEAGVLAIMRPLLEDACRFGKAAEILPLPNHHRLDSISKAWLLPGISAGTVDGNLTAALTGITNQTNTEWYTAMRTFCSSIWGTTDWGKSREGHVWSHDKAGNTGMSHPILSVLIDTCDGVSDAVMAFARAAEDVRSDLHDIYWRAVRDALPHVDTKDGIGLKDVKSVIKGIGKMGKSLAGGIVLEIDEEALNAAVEAYNNRVQRQVPELNKLLPALDEAFLSAPTFLAESARAEAFGARALNDFKKSQLYTVPGDDESNHKYPLDLANQEGIGNSHVIDKHVGKTDEQLEQRLRDQQVIRNGDIRPKAASTFDDLESAQKLTQAVMDDPNNQRKIDNWLNGNPGESSKRNIGLTFNDPTGRTWDRGDSSAHDAYNVIVTLKPVPGGHPPYVVLTSMPTDQAPPQ
ncbi:RNase A-like domain-containing protein [Streptomyces sp.]|uniref:RNase A-like domain-containing protein n=1 Tax=Streptomyces sp. TaxID=1931 RepID=UPI002D771809|nr:RNase A-like domain-containing protein [Streptomyces sp.]HET6359970.1 RNase A-like domain-containing protein [Streptomyces sp.]